jgi:hypothetical protein
VPLTSRFGGTTTPWSAVVIVPRNGSALPVCPRASDALAGDAGALEASPPQADASTLAANTMEYAILGRAGASLVEEATRVAPRAWSGVARCRVWRKRRYAMEIAESLENR